MDAAWPFATIQAPTLTQPQSWRYANISLYARTCCLNTQSSTSIIVERSDSKTLRVTALTVPIFKSIGASNTGPSRERSFDCLAAAHRD